MRPPRTANSRRTALTIVVVILSAIVGALAGRWLVSDPGPGDRQTLSRDIPLLAQNLEPRTENLELGT